MIYSTRLPVLLTKSIVAFTTSIRFHLSLGPFVGLSRSSLVSIKSVILQLSL